MALRSSFARDKFTYSTVAFSPSYVKVQNVWQYYVKSVCGLMAISCRLPTSFATAVLHPRRRLWSAT